MSGTPIGREERQTQKVDVWPCEAEAETGVKQPPAKTRMGIPEAAGGKNGSSTEDLTHHGPAGTLILHCQPPELGYVCCFKPPSL